MTWNSRPYLEQLFAGIAAQHGIDYTVLIIDNASTDGTVEWIEKHIIQNQTGKKEVLIKNEENRGYAGAHNQGFEQCAAPYVLTLNPDAVLEPGFLEHATTAITADASIASIQGKLYQILPKHGKPGIIDSCGLKMRFFGQIVDTGQNTTDKGQYASNRLIFGPTGAVALYRTAALKDVRERNGILDERFHSYKEDVDLAWRLKQAGWKSLFVPKAQAQHIRQVKKGGRNERDERVKLLSQHNHLLMLKKNLALRDWWRIPWIIIYELLKLAYIILFEREILKAYKIVVSHKT